MEWDIFISHASEDKETVARPLATLLRDAGKHVWLDANTLTIGDSLSRKIDHGLANSRYGVIILSKDFFAKGWPQRELTALVQREMQGRKVILPVWHGIDHEYIMQYSPTLADKLAISTINGLQPVSQAILQVLRNDEEARAESERQRGQAQRKEHQRLERQRAESEKAEAELVAAERGEFERKERQGARPESARPWARALLLYVPSGAMSWLLHASFFIYSLVLISAFIGALSNPSDPELVFGLATVYLLCFPAEFLRRLALRIDRRKRFPAEKHLVGPRKRWIPIVLFWFATMMIPLGALTPFMDEPGGFIVENIKQLYPYSMAFGLYFILLAVCARGWANALAKGTSTEPRSFGGVRNAFLLYRPNQPRGWLATVGFLLL